MKKSVLVLILVIFVLPAGFSQRSEKLMGAWEMVYQKWTSPDTTIERNRIQNPPIKVLSSKYFAYGAISGRGHLGEYTYDGKTYIEYIKYSPDTSLISQTVKFNSTLEGDRWNIKGSLLIDNRLVQLEEIWKRLD